MSSRIKIILLVAMLVGISTPLLAADPPRPNIIVILSDDMGYSDIGCYGSEIKTPRLDALAARGLRFTQFYNTARCCPTRASLLTGLYPHQAGVGHMMQDRGTDGYRGNLNNRCATIAGVLRSAGYGTYMAGKWHVTQHTGPDGPKFNWPLQRGFDRFYGTITGAGSFFDPGTLTRDNTMISPFADPLYEPKTYYYTDAISDHAEHFIDDHVKQKPDQPFFMYVAYTCAHWPMHALPEDVARYKGKYDAGYRATREARFERMKKLGVIEENCKLSPQAEDFSEVPEDRREWEVRGMEVYAAMVDRMDQGIGDIVDQLKSSGVYENTLIFYMQDNGGCAENCGRGGTMTRAEAPKMPIIADDAIMTGVYPDQTRDGRKVIRGTGAMPGPDDTYIAYGRGWANVSNTPFREYKHWVHEGGISTPLIAHWPAGIRRHGEREHQPGHLIDIMATCVDLSGAKYPKRHPGAQADVHPMEGVSLAPTFGGDDLPERVIYWEHEGNRAVRQGPWKLVAKSKTGPWELYNIALDRAELNDLSAELPERTKAMALLWQTYAERTGVLPWPGSRKRPKK